VRALVLLLLYRGVGMQGALVGWNNSLAGNFHGLDKRLELCIFVLGLDFGERGFGLRVLLRELDLTHRVCRDQNEVVVADD